MMKARKDLAVQYGIDSANFSDKGRSDQIWVTICQNEQIIQQNEQIIQQNATIINLLQNNTSS